MAWILLMTAGALEIVWATALKKLAVELSWILGIVTAVTMGLSILALYAAMTRIPLGIAYPIWTGIGSVGSILVSVAVFNQHIGMNSVLGVTLLVAGMMTLGADAR